MVWGGCVIRPHQTTSKRLIKDVDSTATLLTKPKIIQQKKDTVMSGSHEDIE